jgi:hypothetical protein
VVSDELTVENLLKRLLPVERRIGRKINPALSQPRRLHEGSSPRVPAQSDRPARIVLIGADDGKA